MASIMQQKHLIYLGFVLLSVFLESSIDVPDYPYNNYIRLKEVNVENKSSNSPDLWIPYILIGVACVTFLAIHFWCYHKRNRERYLRKRDEKRVKSGLMERRRITTLMLARYQSDLGITKRERGIDMTRLFYDNTVDVASDESDDYKKCITTKYQSFHTSGANDEVPMSTGETEAVSNSSSDTKLRTLANSQTWPLVTERKSTPYNAHEGCGNKVITVTDDKSVVNVTKSDKDQVKDVSTDLRQNKFSVDALKQHQGTNRCIFKGNNLETITETITRPDKGQELQPVVLKSYPSTTSYPSVFYTNLNSSQHSTHSSFLSAFKPKHKKRRYDATSINDAERDVTGTNENITVKWGELSKLYEHEKPCSHSPSIYCSSNHSNCYSFVGNEQLCCSHKKLENSGCFFLETEAFPFAEGGLAYGSFSHNSVSENIQMTPLSHLDRNCLTRITDRDALRCDSNVSFENPVSEKDNSMVSSTVDSHTRSSNITTPTHLPNRLPHRNIVIPFTEKSRLNIISKNPAKIRARALENNPTQFWLPRQRSESQTNTDSVNNQNSFPELFVPQCENRDYGIITDPAHTSSTSETPLLTHNPNATGISVRTDNSDKFESSMDYDGDESTSLFNDNDPRRTVENITSSVSNYELSTSSIRDMNRILVFHSMKRKFGIKSD